MELLKTKQEEDRRRLEEQFKENLETQRDQMENMMTANMQEMKQDREAVLSQNRTLQVMCQLKQLIFVYVPPRSV